LLNALAIRSNHLTVNICAKINSKASPNGMVIGNDLYEILSSFSSPSPAADFAMKSIAACLAVD